MVKLGQYGEDKKLIGEILKESRANLYARIQGNDEIGKELQEAMEVIEYKCRSIIGKNN
jgi:hypothetical protein